MVFPGFCRNILENPGKYVSREEKGESFVGIFKSISNASIVQKTFL